jgi:hypothetical protein
VEDVAGGILVSEWSRRCNGRFLSFVFGLAAILGPGRRLEIAAGSSLGRDPLPALEAFGTTSEQARAQARTGSLLGNRQHIEGSVGVGGSGG